MFGGTPYGSASFGALLTAAGAGPTIDPRQGDVDFGVVPDFFIDHWLGFYAAPFSDDAPILPRVLGNEACDYFDERPPPDYSFSYFVIPPDGLGTTPLVSPEFGDLPPLVARSEWDGSWESQPWSDDVILPANPLQLPDCDDFYNPALYAFDLVQGPVGSDNFDVYVPVIPSYYIDAKFTRGGVASIEGQRNDVEVSLVMRRTGAATITPTRAAEASITLRPASPKPKVFTLRGRR